MELYPLIMAPSFRHGQETPWGGCALKERFHKNIPDETTGESLEISALPGCETHAANGSYSGRSLGEILACWGEQLTGSSGTAFPLLLKLLDAEQPLSVQVHPDDAYAGIHEGKPGKSEAWVILDAEPGAKLVYGIDTRGKDFRSVVASGKLEECLHWVPARPGDVFYIPAGTVHALGPGIRCYEIQQSSDVTYRLWDWGRTGKDGRPRELHISRALDVSVPGIPAGPVRESEIPASDKAAKLLVNDPHFRLFSVDLSGSYSLPSGRMLFLTPESPCEICWDGGSQSVNPFQSVLVPAGMQDVTVSGSGRMLMTRAM